MPVSVKPLTVTALDTPTCLSAKLPAPVPVTLTTSLSRPVTVAVPPRLATVVPSYTRLAVVTPVTLSGAGVMLLVLLAAWVTE